MKISKELVAYSVQDLGEIWRWRAYGPGGQVIRQGVEATEDRARQAAASIFGVVVARGAQPVAPARMLTA